MLVPQKCQYALRAVLELCKRRGQGSVTNGEIAKAQAIPPRFLEVILSELKHAGIVSSRRGSAGGYTVVGEPRELSVGKVMHAMQGPVGPVESVSESPASHCPLQGDCAFLPMWEEARKAVQSVYDRTSFQDLLERERAKARSAGAAYSI